ncbi:STAS domain-containing protein [Streptomyces sp. NPDC099050]|uniref:STAS domain-containing protein n=1 Tax=Streptomyces sp. NPDC099050 TaxID=3366100 RepID=UPI003827DB1E
MPVLQSLNLHRHDRGDGTTITLAGELDLDTVGQLRAMVDDCLREGVRTIDIDVSALAFCDVSGLNAFLAVAACTATAKGSLCLHHPRPMLIRLLALTGTGFLLHRLPRAPEVGAWVPAVVCPRLLAS